MPYVDREYSILNDTPSEDFEQMCLIKWIRQNTNLRVFAIPNGGRRSPSEAAKLKATGVSAGVPDLMIPTLRLFLEMKRIKGGVVSPEQTDWMEYLRGCGYSAEVARGCDEAIKIIQKKLL